MAKKYKLIISINYEECAGCGTCEALMPEYFQMGDDGKAWLTQTEIVGTKEEIDEIVSQLQEVVETCPIEGIEYTIEEIEE